MQKTNPVPKGDGLTFRKEVNFSKWYRQVISKSNLIDESNLSGFYVLLTDTLSIWDNIKTELNKQLITKGVKNVYYPLFAPESALRREINHVNGFSAEVAWVTKTGNTQLQEPLAVRPTSETIIYPLYSKWIRSYKELPFKTNAWCNVVRWEFKRATPFIRSREFLWQEGHSAFTNAQNADLEVRDICDLYKYIYENMLAVPVIQGRKSEKEKFAGAEYTLTCECYIPEANRAVQAATAHNLGTKFSKMFDIKYVNINDNLEYVHQTSYGLTTRSIGIMVMTHSDNKGLVLPPKVAPIQTVIIPHFDKAGQVLEVASKLYSEIEKSGYRVHLDDRKEFKAGYKFADWELHGVPIRLELGLREIKNNTIKVVTRYNGESGIENINNIVDIIGTLINTIQTNMLENAKQKVKYTYADTLKQFVDRINNGMVLVPHCGTVECENKVLSLKDGIKSLCQPFSENISALDKQCFNCDNKGSSMTLFGRSY